MSATEPNTSLAWAHEVGARKLTGEDAIHWWWTVRAQKAEAELDALHEQLDRDGIARAPLAVRVRCRIQELAAERDAAIDARLTAEEQSRRWRVRAETLEAANANASVGERVANALMLRDQAAERVREREAYLLRRTAALLESTGYTTVERAAAEARRELAVVLGGGS